MIGRARQAGTWALAMGIMLAGTQADSQSSKILEPSDTSSPRATFASFVKACEQLYELAEDVEDEAAQAMVLPTSELILDCLDLSGLPDELRDSSGLESGVYLKEVLDRVPRVPIAEIPDSTDAAEPVQRFRVPGTRIEIVRISEGPDEGRYLFSARTIKRAANYYSAAKLFPYRKSSDITPGFQERYIAATKKQPTLSADTTSPRGTLSLFQQTFNQIYDVITTEQHVDRSDIRYLPMVRKLLSCIDASAIPEYAREHYAVEAAVCIKEVLDRIDIPPPEKIPGPENLQASDDGQSLARWQIPNTDIVIERIQDGPRRGAFLFSSDTVQRAPKLYEKYKSLPYLSDVREVTPGLHTWYITTPSKPTLARWASRFPDWMRLRVLKLALWQWLGLVIGVILCLAIVTLGNRVRQWSRPSSGGRSLLLSVFTIAYAVTALASPLLFKHIAYEYVTVRGTPQYAVNFAADLVFLAVLVGVIVAISKRAADVVILLPSIQSNGLDAHLIRMGCRLMGIVASAVVFLEGGRYLGFPITTLLASAGIGGLAIALSAQGMMKGLFGTVTILLDRPFRVGERIVVKGQDGFVEEIGLRSTKIRTFLTNHLVSIPNDQIAECEVENIGQRTHMRRMTDLHIPLDTPRAKVEQAVEIIRQTLAEHPGMDPKYPPRVYFNEFNTDSFNIRLIYWYCPPNLWEFYSLSERLNLAIFRAFEENNIQFSLPFRHTYWKHDESQGPLDVSITAPQPPSDEAADR